MLPQCQLKGWVSQAHNSKAKGATPDLTAHAALFVHRSDKSNTVRQVANALYSFVQPTPASGEPYTISYR